MKKRLLSFAAVLAMTTAAFAVIPAYAQQDQISIFSSDAASAKAADLEISTLEELEAFRDSVNEGNAYKGKYILLTADIDMSAKYNENGLSWESISNATFNYPFAGTFDGGGHIITGLYINDTSMNDPGALDDFSAFLGYNAGTVQNLTIDGSVTSSANSIVSGIVGYNEGTVKNCHNACAVTSTCEKDVLQCAGVVGWNNKGGVVGKNNEGTVENCCNTGTVSCAGTAEVGGVVGQTDEDTIVANCYNAASIYAPKARTIGGVIGVDDDKAVITNCYYDNKKYVGQDTITGVTGKNSLAFAYGEVAYLLQSANETQVWGQKLRTENADEFPVLTSEPEKTVYKTEFMQENEQGNDYKLYQTRYSNAARSAEMIPVFPPAAKVFLYWSREQNGQQEYDFAHETEESDLVLYPVYDETLPLFEGGGTEDDPYLIPDLETLERFRDYVNLYNNCENQFFQITADIDMSPKYGKNVGGAEVSWTPIGEYSIYGSSIKNEFSGTLDGDGHIISNLYINAGIMESYQGLVGRLANGTVKNLTVSGGSVSAQYQSVGGIVAGNMHGTVENCHNIGCSVVSVGEFTGGVVGHNRGILKDCSNIGAAVSGNRYVGGITGASIDVSLKNCYNTGSVAYNTNTPNTGSSEKGLCIGGIVGVARGGTLQNCYNTGSVSGGKRVGGVAGFSSASEIESCYNIGSVLAEEQVGSVVGHITKESTITNCYYLKTEDINSELDGVGENYNTEENLVAASAKDLTAFECGEVAYLLQSGQAKQVWGQKLIPKNDKDPNPVLTSENAKKVLKVTFATEANPAYEIVYTNPNSTVVFPQAPTMDGYTFDKWSLTDSDDNIQEFTADMPVTEDITVYAKWNKNSAPSGSGSSGGGGGGSWKGSGSVPSTTPADDSQEPSNQPADNSFWFVDVPEYEWYYAPIKYVFEKGLMLGTSETEFEPETNITRGMFVTILHRMENKPTASIPHSFEDVPSGEYYADAVAWASEQGIVEGYSSAEYAPDRTIAREEMAAILYRYTGFKGYDRSAQEDLRYSDSNNISEYAKIPISWNSAVGIMHGNEDNTFAPQGFATRAEAAAVFQRMAEYFIRNT